MKRFLALAGLVAATTALATPAAFAAESTTTSTDATSPSAATPLEKVNAYVGPSVVYERMHWSAYVWDRDNKQYLNNGKPFVLDTQCTGYVVNPNGYIATAGHCVDRKGDVLDMLKAEAAQWAIDKEYYYPYTYSVDDIVAGANYQFINSENKNGPDLNVKVAWAQSAGGVATSKAISASVIKYEPFDKGDGALLKVDATNLPAIQLADSADLGVGTEVVSIGYPAAVDSVTDADLNASYKEGSISSVKTVGDGLSTVYEISAAVSGGMSGGPTVDLNGQVVGFNSFRIAAETQQFNFVRPASTITAMMADAGVDNEPGELSTMYRKGLDAYFAGDKTAAVAAFQGVLDAQPTHSMAQQFLTKSKALPDPVKPKSDSSGGFPVMLASIGGAMVLLLGALGALFLRKRGGSSPAPASAPAPYGDPQLGAAPQAYAPAAPVAMMAAPVQPAEAAAQGWPAPAATVPVGGSAPWPQPQAWQQAPAQPSAWYAAPQPAQPVAASEPVGFASPQASDS